MTVGVRPREGPLAISNPKFYFCKSPPPPSWPNLRTLVLYSDYICAKNLEDIQKYHGGGCRYWALQDFQLCYFLYRGKSDDANLYIDDSDSDYNTPRKPKKAKKPKMEMGFDNTPRCVMLDDLLNTVTNAMLAMPKLEEIEIYVHHRGPESGAKPFIRFNKNEMLAQRKFSLFGEGFERAPNQKGLTVGSRFTAHGLAPLDDFREINDKTVHHKSLAGSGRAQAVLLNWAKFLWRSVGRAWMEERKGRRNGEEGKVNSESGPWVVDEPNIPCWLTTFIDPNGVPELNKPLGPNVWEFGKEIVRCGMDWEKSVCGPLSRDKELWRVCKEACHNNKVKEDERLLVRLERRYVRELRGLLSREEVKGGKRSRESDEGVDEDQVRNQKKRLL